ncbi:hypothetical protein ACTXT7_015225 [Hymenolepis weldensis]
MNSASRLPLLLAKRCYKPIVIRTKNPLTTKERVGYSLNLMQTGFDSLMINREVSLYPYVNCGKE